MSMKETLRQLKDSSLCAIMAAENIDALEALRVKYLGKKGELTAILKQMGTLSAEERPVVGQLANEVRQALADSIEQRRKALAEKLLEMRLRSETLDITMPGKPVEIGKSIL